MRTNPKHPFYAVPAQVYLKLWFTLRRESTRCLLKGLRLLECRSSKNEIENVMGLYYNF